MERVVRVTGIDEIEDLLGDPSWLPGPDTTKAERERFGALCAALNLEAPDWSLDDWGYVGQGVELNSVGAGKYAMVKDGRVAYEGEPTAREKRAVEPTPIYTLAEVATRLHVSVYTVRRMIQRGELTAAKLGKAYLVTELDLDTCLKAHGSQGLRPAG